MTERAFDAVLFDLSGVMTTSAFGPLARMGAGGGHGEAEVLDLLLGPYHEDTDHPWHRVERGEIPITEWVQEKGQLVDPTLWRSSALGGRRNGMRLYDLRPGSPTTR